MREVSVVQRGAAWCSVVGEEGRDVVLAWVGGSDSLYAPNGAYKDFFGLGHSRFHLYMKLHMTCTMHMIQYIMYFYRLWSAKTMSSVLHFGADTHKSAGVCPTRFITRHAVLPTRLSIHLATFKCPCIIAR